MLRNRKKQRVLQVTHDDGHLLTALLTPDGHEVTEADGTSQALALTALEQFDLIVVENGSPVEATRRAGEILESIGDAFFSLDEELRFTYVNRKAEEIWGMRREDLLGRKFMDVFPHVEGSHSNLEIMRAWEEGRPHTYETVSPIIGRWVEVSAYPSSGGLSVYFRDVTGRKRAEAALRESEEQFRATFEQAAVGVAHTAPDGRWLRVNRKLCDIFGYTREELLAGTFQEVTHPEDLEPNLAQNRRLLAGETDTYSIEKRYFRKDGSHVWCNLTVSLVRDDADGEPSYFVAVIEDITERKLAEEALRASEERFAKAFQANPQPMSLTTLEEGLYVDVNESFLAMSGYVRGEVIGRTSLELNIWETPAARAAFVRQLKGQGTIRNLETLFRTTGGAFRVLLSSAEQMEIDGRRCILVASSDITERKAAAEALRKSEKRFRATFEQAAVGVAHSGSDGRLLLMNRKLCDILGYAPEEMRTKTYQEVTHPEDLIAELEYARRLLAGEIKTASYEKRYIRKDGSPVWVNLTASLVRNEENGEPFYFVAIIEDISARKATEESLKSALAEVRLLKDRLQEENVYLREEAKLERHFGEIVGRSDAIKYVLHKVERVAPTDSTVLVTGETGTGKELVARAIHGESHRHHRPLVKVNCAALSPGLIESELFGHERGAFTGAAGRKAGRFELADGATLFLDEIGELPLELQPKLLRVLQDGEFERLGSAHAIRVDVRIIAATNRDLWKEVQAGAFREDLFYRLNVFPITMPPLRQRAGDIPLLIEHFVGSFSRKMGKKITSVTPATLYALSNYPWPGNVRELANVIERAVINNGGPVLQISNLAETLHAETPSAPSKTLEEMEREYIITVLDGTGWRIEGQHGAARILGLHPSTLRTRMAKLKVQKQQTNST